MRVGTFGVTTCDYHLHHRRKRESRTDVMTRGNIQELHDNLLRNKLPWIIEYDTMELFLLLLFLFETVIFFREVRKEKVLYSSSNSL